MYSLGYYILFLMHFIVLHTIFIVLHSIIIYLVKPLFILYDYLKESVCFFQAVVG